MKDKKGTSPQNNRERKIKNKTIEKIRNTKTKRIMMSKNTTNTIHKT